MESNFEEHLSQLRGSILEMEGLSAESREKLLQRLNDLEQAVPGEEGSHQPPLKQLEESLLEVEARHPDATHLLKSLADALGRMGL